MVTAYDVTSGLLTTLLSPSNPCVSVVTYPRVAVPDCAGNLWMAGACRRAPSILQDATLLLLLADTENNALLLWNATTSSTTMLFSGPPLNSPKGLALASNVVFLANNGDGTISSVRTVNAKYVCLGQAAHHHVGLAFQYDIATGVIHTFATGLASAYGIVLDGEAVYHDESLK